jgi:hypothetical protein
VPLEGGGVAAFPSVSYFFRGTEPVIDVTTVVRTASEEPIVRAEPNLLFKAVVFGPLLRKRHVRAGPSGTR